jgi:alkylation response protein AidB-like acyl-CoA dehydrogenase
MPPFTTPPVYAPAEGEAALRSEVRVFLREHLPGGVRAGLGMDADFNPEFSEALAARGWVGMALPEEYGGAGLGALERFVVVEELLAAGAPVAAHWLADRQTGPLIARFGSDELKRRFLPKIAAGRCFFCVGLSEPDSGSDLASVRTCATKVPGGWEINGAKVWTSGAHLAQFATVLLRTAPVVTDRHEGLSQIIVDLADPGVSIDPIVTMDGEHHFNQVTFTNVFAADEMLLGELGRGWAQVTSELVSERAGPDRYMSVVLLLQGALARFPEIAEDHARELGMLLARLATVRRMSHGIVALIDAGGNPGIQVPLVKDLGTTFEQDVVAFLRDVLPAPLRLGPGDGAELELLTRAVLTAPTFTLRGGTVQILRNLIARELA